MPANLPHLPYYQTHEFTASLLDRPIRIISKPGIAYWNEVTPATRLLADAVVLGDSPVLVLGCGHGALGVVLARQVAHGNVLMLDTNVVARAMAERTLRANQVTNASVCLEITVLPEQAGTFATAAMEAPSNRKLARRWLVEAYEALQPGGQLYLAGPNNQGIQSIIDDAGELFGNVAVVAYKAKNRVARATKGSASPALPTWAGEPGIAPGTWYEWDAAVGEHIFHLHSLPGVFSWDRLDAGTALLLATLEIHRQAHVLDVGCGYGIIGLVAARRGAGHVDMVDVDLLAVAAAEKNIAANNAGNARAFPSDALAAVDERRYDLVVSNPPFHTGKAIAYDAAHAFIQHARHVLKPGGRLLLVANRFIRYDQLMGDVFSKVERLAESPGFHVLAAER